MPHQPVRPLLITADSGVQDAVLAVAEQATVEVTVASDVGAAAALWAAAPLVLVDAVLVDAAVRLLPVPRSGLVVVSRTIDDTDTWRHLVALGAEYVVELPEGAPWLFQRFGRSLEPAPEAEVVVVAGAVGGAGTSTLAASIAAVVRERGDRSVLVDLDPTGGGLDLLVGAEGVEGARWDELAGITGSVNQQVLMDALPKADGQAVLSWSGQSDLEPAIQAVGHVLDALSRQRGTVVVDGGRLVDPRSVVAVARCRQLIVVVPLRVRAVAAARRLLRRLPSQVSPTIVVREPAPGGLVPRDVEAALGLPVSAVLPEDRRRAVNEELGAPAPTSAAWQRIVTAIDRGADVAA